MKKLQDKSLNRLQVVQRLLTITTRGLLLETSFAIKMSCFLILEVFKIHLSINLPAYPCIYPPVYWPASLPISQTRYITR